VTRRTTSRVESRREERADPEASPDLAFALGLDDAGEFEKLHRRPRALPFDDLEPAAPKPIDHT
jgi:hypothetical protein